MVSLTELDDSLARLERVSWASAAHKSQRASGNEDSTETPALGAPASLQSFYCGLTVCPGSSGEHFRDGQDLFTHAKLSDTGCAEWECSSTTTKCSSTSQESHFTEEAHQAKEKHICIDYNHFSADSTAHCHNLIQGIMCPNGCGMFFGSSAALTHHIQHSGCTASVESVVFSCVGCGQQYASQEAKDLHEAGCPKVWVCPGTCKSRFSSEEQLRQHARTLHSAGSDCTVKCCSKCGDLFPDRPSFYKHQQAGCTRPAISDNPQAQAEEIIRNVEVDLATATVNDGVTRRRRLRELQLQWHPDRNADRVDVATLVFHHIDECWRTMPTEPDEKELMLTRRPSLIGP